MANTRRPKSASELGDSGVPIFNGIIMGDEYRPELRGHYAFKVYDEMRRGDATVHAGLMAVKYPIISVSWSTESGGEDDVDQQAKELIDYNFTEVLNWRETLTDMLTMLDFGFYVAELVFDWRSVNGVDRIVLTKIAYRKQTTIRAWCQEDGTPGITQVLSTGKFVSIPQDKIIVLSHQKEGDNYEGISILRSAYQNWYYKKTFYQIDAVKHERQALGVVKIKYPKGADTKMRDEAKAAAANVRANERAYIEEPDGWDINFMDMQANTTADPKESIAHHDRQILKNMAVQYIDIGSARSSGSLAASNDQRALLEEQDQAIAEQIAAAVNDVIVKKIVDLNFTVTDYPKWKPGRVAREDVAVLADAVTKFKTAGMLTPSDEDEEYTRSVLHFPDMNEDLKGEDRQPQPAVPNGESSGDLNVPDKGTTTDDTIRPEDVKLEAARKRRQRSVTASISARDYPDLYDGTGVDPNDLGCIMMDVAPMKVMDYVPDDFTNDLIDATTQHDHTMGAVAETEAHVTLLYGLLENGNTWKDKVDAVLDGWSMPEVTIANVDYFETPDSFAVIAHVELTPELIDGHERLTLLPHVQTFSEYKPHITLAYVSKDADINQWVSDLGSVYNGATVKTTGINYGDLPDSAGTVDASAHLIDTARQLRAAITEKLYESPSAA